MRELEALSELENVLSPLDDEARRYVMLQVEETWRVPPMDRRTIAGDEDTIPWRKFGSLRKGNAIDYDKADQMMDTGQIAWPMLLKKAPVISIVRSASGFDVTSADKRIAELAKENMSYILPKIIDEILTMLEYGSYYGEVVWQPAYPQDYGLTKSSVPYWIIKDIYGCHPSTINKILREESPPFRFLGFEQAQPRVMQPVKIGTERALIIPNNGTFGNLQGESVLTPVYVWWFWYELVWRSFLRFLQRAGVGVVIVKAPSRGTVTVNGRRIECLSWALQMASGLHRTNYAAIPSDFDPDTGKELWAIDYMKMGDREGEQFIDALNLLATNIKNYLLTGDADSDDSGEFEVMLDTERVLGHIGQYFTDYIMPKYLAWNGSSTRFASLDFQGANSRVLPLLFKLMAVAGNTAGSALRNVDWRELFTKGGVPVLTEDEVEEKREEEIDEMREVRKYRYNVKEGGEGEGAKGQPGGEGRWTRQRDEEGQSERMEMVAEALGTSLLTLTAPQVARLEDLGIRVSDTPITLFNPYHDIRGKFTDRAHATTPMPDDKFHVAEYASKRSQFLAKDAASVAFENTGVEPRDVTVHGRADTYTRSLCGKNLLCRTVTRGSYAAATDGNIHISPKGMAAIRKDRKFGEYALSHEALHTRERSNGSTTLDFSVAETFDGKSSMRTMEEGATDLLARNANGVDHEYWLAGAGRPGYMQQMGAIAIIAAWSTNWDREEAWKIIDGLHYHINDWGYIASVLSNFIGTPESGWTEQSVYALMRELQRSAKSGKYKELGWLFGG